MPNAGVSPGKVLIAEDDVDIALLLRVELESEGYLVRHELDGLKALAAARQESPDLVILDRMLPGLDGLEVCRRLRKTSTVPIMIMSALGRPGERVEGLEAGATDYLPKPFHIEELVARVAAQLRLARPPAPPQLALDDLEIDPVAHHVSRAGTSLALSPKEFDLLAYLVRHARQVKSH